MVVHIAIPDVAGPAQDGWRIDVEIPISGLRRTAAGGEEHVKDGEGQGTACDLTGDKLVEGLQANQNSCPLT